MENTNKETLKQILNDDKLGKSLFRNGPLRNKWTTVSTFVLTYETFSQKNLTYSAMEESQISKNERWAKVQVKTEGNMLTVFDVKHLLARLGG